MRKRNVSLRRFFYSSKTYVYIEKSDNNYYWGLYTFFYVYLSIIRTTSPVENQNDLELDFKVFFFVDSCCVGIILDESN